MFPVSVLSKLPNVWLISVCTGYLVWFSLKQFESKIHGKSDNLRASAPGQLLDVEIF